MQLPTVKKDGGSECTMNYHTSGIAASPRRVLHIVTTLLLLLLLFSGDEVDARPDIAHPNIAIISLADPDRTKLYAIGVIDSAYVEVGCGAIHVWMGSPLPPNISRNPTGEVSLRDPDKVLMRVMSDGNCDPNFGLNVVSNGEPSTLVVVGSDVDSSGNSYSRSWVSKLDQVTRLLADNTRMIEGRPLSEDAIKSLGLPDTSYSCQECCGPYYCCINDICNEGCNPYGSGKGLWDMVIYDGTDD